MEARYKVSTGSMVRDAKRLKELSDSIPRLVHELEGAMGELAGCWDGAAWMAYQEKVAEYVDSLTEIYRSMTIYVECIDEAAILYRRAEQDNCSIINSVLII